MSEENSSNVSTPTDSGTLPMHKRRAYRLQQEEKRKKARFAEQEGTPIEDDLKLPKVSAHINCSKNLEVNVETLLSSTSTFEPIFGSSVGIVRCTTIFSVKNI
jgi:hypothetical protein